MLHSEIQDLNLKQRFILSEIRNELIRQNVSYNHLEVIAGSLAHDGAIAYDFDNNPYVRINDIGLKTYVASWVTKKENSVFIDTSKPKTDVIQKSLNELSATERNKLYKYSSKLFEDGRQDNWNKKIDIPVGVFK